MKAILPPVSKTLRVYQTTSSQEMYYDGLQPSAVLDALPARVTADTPDGEYLRTGLVGRGGFFTFGSQGIDPSAPRSLVRGYDAAGRRVMQRSVVLPVS